MYVFLFFWPHSMAVKAWSPNHGTAREFPRFLKMGKGLQEMLLQRIYTNGQYSYEKILSIPHLWGNTNLNHFLLIMMAIILKKKKQKTTGAGEDVKSEPCSIAGRGIKWFKSW